VIFLLIVTSPYLFGQGQTNDSITILFSIDASSLTNKDYFGIRGSALPLSWENTYPLIDDNGDGVFEAKISFAKSDRMQVLEYKFVHRNNPVIWELEGANRLLVFDRDRLLVDNLKWNVAEPIEVDRLPNLSKDKLQEDFKLAKSALLSLHPGLYRYNTPQQIDSLFAVYETLFQKPMTYREVYLTYSEMLSSIRCGHTFANFFNQSDFIQEVVFNQADKLPFLLRIVDGRMIVTQNLSGNPQLDNYPEILSINGIVTDDILKDLIRYVKADGANDGKRLADLNLFGIGPFESFDVYFPLRYPPINRTYELKIQKSEKGVIKEVKINTISRKERTEKLLKVSAESPTKADDFLWKLEFWDDETAYLQLRTFDVFQLNFEWDDFLKDAFNQIRKRKAANLVLDIRWNEGGQDEILLYLGRMLAKKPVSAEQRTEFVAYEKVPDELKPYLSTWMQEVYDFTGEIKKEENGLYRLTNPDNLQVEPTSKGFKGNVYLLVNEANSSATFYFAELAKSSKLATLVGTTTGGSQKGLNGGTMFFFRLPNSKIEFDIPIIGTFSLEKPDTGISPNIEVKETLESLRAGIDPIILKVRELIDK
jgi:hypothetical protein